MHISDIGVLDFVARDLGNAPRPKRSVLRGELATLLPLAAACTLLALLTAMAIIMSGADPASLALG